MQANSTNSSTPAPIPQTTVTSTTKRDKVAEEIALYQKSLRDMILVKRLLQQMSTTKAPEADLTTTDLTSELPIEKTTSTPSSPVTASEELIFEEEEVTVEIIGDETTESVWTWRDLLDQAIRANMPTNDE